MRNGPLATNQPRRIVVACAALAFVLVASPGHAQQQPPPDASAVDQYVEAVPTASGPSVPGITKAKRTQLSPRAKRALKKRAPKTASALEDVATSSTYGAPAASETKPTRARPRSPDDVPPAPSLSAALESTLTAVGETSDTRLLGLLLVVVATTAGAIGLAVRRARV